jgi:energy-coupling factor transport system ATP-binding protein
LADAVTSVRLAFRLRGERFGPRALVPILERTLEHAARVAAALELRGFGSTHAHRSTDDGGTGHTQAPLLVRDARFRIVNAELHVADFEPRPGTVSVLTGPTGSGKSTILRGIAGLLSHVDGGNLTGVVRVAGLDRAATPPRETARSVGVVLQNPRAAFAATRVRDEIALALDLRGVAAADTRARVAEVAKYIGVSALLDRTISTLSAGEAALVAIAAAVVEQPDLLLVDEPLADLDTPARARVIAVLQALARDAGVCVIVAEHRAQALIPIADSWWAIRDGALVPGTAPAPSASAVAPPTAVPNPASAPVLTASHLSVHKDGNALVRDASVTLHRREVTALVGPNGAGKSSVLVALALGGGKGVEGTIDTGTADGGRVALVPDASDDLFTRDTVAAELRAAERRLARRRDAAPVPPGFAAAHLARLRGDAGMPIGHEHPRDLSAGERRILAVALQTLDRPRVLLIDEPTRGLDPAARTAVARALRAAAEDGAAILIATHDLPFAHGLGARILPMRDGVAPAAEPESATECASPPQPITLPRLPDGASGKPGRRIRLPRPVELTLLAVANVVALGAFCWPLLAAALPTDAAAALPYAALAIAPVAAVAVVVSLDGSVRSAHTVALLGVLAAVGSAVRVASTGVHPAGPGRPCVRPAVRAAAGCRHDCVVQCAVGRDRAVDAVPGFRVCVGGRRGRAASETGARQGRAGDAGRVRDRGVLPVRAADQPVVLAVRGGRRHGHLLRTGGAAGHQPQQLPAVFAADLDGRVGHAACRNHGRRGCRGGPGDPGLTAPGEARVSWNGGSG